MTDPLHTPHPATAIIPARLGSTRFPAKVLADQTGRPLIQHVVEAASRASLIGKVVVATDDTAVRMAVEQFGGTAVMTRPDHPNGTSRLAEAAQILGLSGDDVIVNVQGDEPEIEGHVIDAAVRALYQTGAEVSTVASPFAPGEDPADPNIVKVVTGSNGYAMYFSRARIPHARAGGVPVPPMKHIGLYCYRARFLQQYAAMEPTPLERSEMLEQLRVLEHGHRIGVAVCAVHTAGIDTPEQYAAFVARWKARPHA